ncbi:hypothetical protein IGI04_043028, partial [Brassica rapa subsp. trilocularis]
GHDTLVSRSNDLTAHTDVCGCLWLSVSTHRISVAVRVCPSAHTGHSWLSISTHIRTLVLGLSMLAFPVDCSGDFGPRGLSVQYTQDIYGCPSAHTGRPCVSVSTHGTSVAVRVCLCVSVSTHKTSVAVHQYKYQHVCPWTQHVDPSRGLFGTSVAVRGCLRLSVSTHRTSVAVHQYTYQHAGPWTQHAGPSRGLFGLFWPTWAICSVHTGRPWVSTSKHPYVPVASVYGCPSAHRMSVTLTIPVDCSGDFGPRGLSVQYTKDVAHTGHSWLSISTHISTLVLGLTTLAFSVDCLGDFGPRGLSVQYTKDVRGCPLAHTGRPWLSMAVCQHTQDVCGCPCVTMCVRQHTQDVCGCPPAHIGRLWVSVSTPGRPCVSVSTHMTFVAVCVCPCVSVNTHRTFAAVHQYTYQHSGPWTQHADPSRGLFG